MDSDQVLDLPIEDHYELGDTTIRGYLKALLHRLWEEGEGFSSKRPFGNSSWEDELILPLVKQGIVKGSFDEDGYLEDFDWAAGSDIIKKAIEAL